MRFHGAPELSCMQDATKESGCELFKTAERRRRDGMWLLERELGKGFPFVSIREYKSLLALTDPGSDSLP